MPIKIYQGNDMLLRESDITVVIDVIRAFTVAHYAFLKGVEKILLVATVDEAFHLKNQNPNLVLAGEIKGLPISGFELDNSPAHICHAKVEGKTLVQKTTNGVKATLNSLQAKDLYVTGFSNARTTATYLKKQIDQAERECHVHIVASHPTGDDDLACAEYMKGILEGNDVMDEKEVVERIINSHVAEKFFDASQPEFNADDLKYCVKELKGEFVMKVNKTGKIPTIERFFI
ncbi:2-phosphosulfolactate phosphatase [Metabacillus niabensis]|uniref:Probable 2-phosphosulfolactate phosphatase n=1 Tax=Metabacillus niabensis TaxID=324854 RepID=A0ABT9Z6Q4_9BACI|nr:2-phosphosulfolactate phosphatase [Metabacillus niabensis]MDQ0226970.1 2-phosphosulfolactate phosphatase [Metabacillus niabensis]